MAAALDVCRQCLAVETTVRKNAQTELDLYRDPQPVKTAPYALPKCCEARSVNGDVCPHGVMVILRSVKTPCKIAGNRNWQHVDVADVIALA